MESKTHVIVTTTIYPPTEALRKFSEIKGWNMVVIGDKKTPTDWHLPGVWYMSPEEQEAYDRLLSDSIGWNCIGRRNLGLLAAKGMKADVVAVVDDDNIPYDNWGKNLMVDREVEVTHYATDFPAFDPVGATNYKHLWHRGFPLELLPSRDYTHFRYGVMTPDVQADFWNGNHDIDAVCRMEHAPECAFQSRYFPIASNAPSPFNSQNTFISGHWLKHYFLCPEIGRMDDIWAAYYLQALGAKVVYGEPSVYQQRNEHNLITDMRAEYLGYEHNLELINALKEDANNYFKFLPSRAIEAFKLYQRHFQ